MAKYKDLIQEARKKENQDSGNTENQNEQPKVLAKEPDVNLTIKVAARRRRHWASQAKLHGITLTAVITEALSKKFGDP